MLSHILLRTLPYTLFYTKILSGIIFAIFLNDQIHNVFSSVPGTWLILKEHVCLHFIFFVPSICHHLSLSDTRRCPCMSIIIIINTNSVASTYSILTVEQGDSLTAIHSYFFICSSECP